MQAWITLTRGYRRAGSIRALACIVSCLGVLGITSAWASTDVYWTGGGNDGLWSNPANWVDGDSIQRVPGSNDVAWVGHATHTPDAHQAIVVDADTLINQLQFVGTADRSAALTATNDATLSINAALHAINVPSSAMAALMVNLPVAISVAGGTQESFSNLSSSTVVTIGPDASISNCSQFTYMYAGTFRVLSTQPGSSAVLRFRERPTVIADLQGSALARGSIQTDGATLLLASDAVAGTPSPWVRLRGGNLNIGITETTEDVRFVIGMLTTYASGDPTRHVQLVESPDGSPGHLTVAISSLGAADNSPWIHTIAGSTVELSTGIPAVSDPANPGISGGGNLLLKGASAATVYEFARHMTYTGRTMLETGIMSLAASGSLPESTIVEIGGDAALRVNHERTVGGISDYSGSTGTLDLNGGALTVHATQASAFGGTISGTGALVKDGEATWSLTAGYTNAAGRTLRIADGLLAVTGALSVEDGAFELAGGRITAGSLASEDTVWNVTLHEADEGETLVTAGGNANITGATLELVLAGGYEPVIGREYVLLYAGSITGAAPGDMLFGRQDGEIFEQNGQEYVLRWEDGSAQIILTAIPEPGTLGLVLLAAGLLIRRRSRR